MALGFCCLTIDEEKIERVYLGVRGDTDITKLQEGKLREKAEQGGNGWGCGEEISCRGRKGGPWVCTLVSVPHGQLGKVSNLGSLGRGRASGLMGSLCWGQVGATVLRSGQVGAQVLSNQPACLCSRTPEWWPRCVGLCSPCPGDPVSCPLCASQPRGALHAHVGRETGQR